MKLIFLGHLEDNFRIKWLNLTAVELFTDLKNWKWSQMNGSNVILLTDLVNFVNPATARWEIES